MDQIIDEFIDLIELLDDKGEAEYFSVLPLDMAGLSCHLFYMFRLPKEA